MVKKHFTIFNASYHCGTYLNTTQFVLNTILYTHTVLNLKLRAVHYSSKSKIRQHQHLSQCREANKLLHSNKQTFQQQRETDTLFYTTTPNQNQNT